MSYRYSDSRRSSGGGGRDSGRRDSSPPRHRSRRSPSPGPSRGRSSPKRDEKSLPESFGRVQDSGRPVDDEQTVLQRMKNAYENSPLADLSKCISQNKKVKIWTRNYKEVRGVMTGYILAFDKHWNLVLRDVDEVYLKPKKSKTPFLREVAANENLPDIPAKVPKQKKTEGTEETPAPPPVTVKVEKEGDDSEKKKKKRRKKAKSTSAKRQIDKLFIRGDNIVMICPMDENPAMEEEDEDEEEEEEGQARSSG